MTSRLAYGREGNMKLVEGYRRVYVIKTNLGMARAATHFVLLGKNAHSAVVLNRGEGIFGEAQFTFSTLCCHHAFVLIIICTT